ncbi:MAG: ImmA/IrrE family metallo-endopeptidase [Anaerovoracaceae bacterium]|jgi:Zn-dependent peptidase ImmA (M78 family)
MPIESTQIVQTASRIVDRCGSRDPRKIADELGIVILECPFHRQRGAYKIIQRNRFIFVKQDLHPVMKDIVLLHEIGHDTLHRREATAAGGFQEFEIFNMASSRMEYEANVFAAQAALDDEAFLTCCAEGFDAQQIACALHSDVNLVALKADTLIARGYRLRPQAHDNTFLRGKR